MLVAEFLPKHKSKTTQPLPLPPSLHALFSSAPAKKTWVNFPTALNLVIILTLSQRQCWALKQGIGPHVLPTCPSASPSRLTEQSVSVVKPFAAGCVFLCAGNREQAMLFTENAVRSQKRSNRPTKHYLVTLVANAGSTHLSLRATRTQQADTKAANMSFSVLKAATVHAGLLLSASLEKNKKHFHVQNGLLHDNGRYRFQNVAKTKKKTHLGKQNTSSRMLRQTMQDCSGEVQVM